MGVGQPGLNLVVIDHLQLREGGGSDNNLAA